MLGKGLLRLVSTLLFLAIPPAVVTPQQPSAYGDASYAAGEAPHATDGSQPGPPKAPRVSCQNGQLTIVADNSTMSSIFTAIRACIGVDIQAPVGFDDDRSFISLGPGPAREVLNEFLSGTDFDYVIQSSLSNAREIKAIQLAIRAKDVLDRKDALAANLTMTPARRTWLANRNAERRTTTADDNVGSTDPQEPQTPSTDNAPSPAADTNVAATGVAASTEVKDQPTDQKQDQTKDQPQDKLAAVEATTAGPVAASGAGTAPASDPDSSDGSQAAPAPSVLQKQINQMEQLFEQRKQMTAKPAPSTSPTPDPN